MAHLKISESAYQTIAERFPIAEREVNLFRSEFFVVAAVTSDLLLTNTKYEMALKKLFEWVMGFIKSISL
ncbi:hypothetical protein MUN86_27680 (plasmid) [Hymenobacter volaticus]|uniref:HEPN domain-containing protein n=1 Tax=Hymenobacter volaticus TaxID=2932254 RepID=A0ABY4GE81_9BACT|nr:hypothetical protein MUN86_27680 [Hymenobacter volaticus]